METDRRATLEAALEAAEKGHESTQQNDVLAAVTNTDTDAATTTQNVATDSSKIDDASKTAVETKSRDDATKIVATEVVTEAATKPQSVEDKTQNVDRAPQAWKPAQKAKWQALDPDIRQEISRREYETTRVLNETAQARQFVGQFQEAIQPYRARIQQVGDPIKAVQNLLAVDHLLSTGPKTQKAQFLAKLVKDYDIDIVELDAALAGTAPADPVKAQVEQLINERLSPYQQYVQQQQIREQQAQEYQQQQILKEVQAMSTDPAYPHFEAVRETMADLIDTKVRRGVSIDLATAYNMAVAMDPELSQQVLTTQQEATRRRQAAEAHAKAQRALEASSSVSGAPRGSNAGTPQTTDRRAHLEAAFASLEGR